MTKPVLVKQQHLEIFIYQNNNILVVVAGLSGFHLGNYFGAELGYFCWVWL